MARRVRLPPAVIRFVARHRVAHLATVDRGGQPHAVPVCFAWHRGTLYSVIDLKPKRVAPGRLRRVQNIAANPRVAVVVDTYREDWSRLAFVVLEGRARLLRRGLEHASALRHLRRKYTQYKTMDLRRRPIIAVRVRRATGWGRL